MSSPSDNGSSSTAPEVRHGTLPPPEWTANVDAPVSAATLALEMHEGDPPVSRRTGPRAELAFHQARVRAYNANNDTEGERASATALARALVTRGTDLDWAAKLARRALLIGHDLSLRDELSTWFAALGEPALAAATLRPLVAELSGPDSARVLTRIGVLLGRAGDAAGAADALFDAARDDPSDPVAPELQAGIGAWAPNAVSAERAAEGYLEGYRRRDAAGDRAAGFEDLLRAFEMAPGEPQPSQRLAAALVVRGRLGAADEVLREHARASADRARSIHLKRMRHFAETDLPRALGAGFDARLDAETDLERAFGSITRAAGFDDLLEHAGLHELVAARIELACDELVGSERALARMTLSSLYSGTLASPERAVEAWVDALLADPENHDAWTQLKNELSTSGDAHTWVDALLRIAHGGAPADVRRRSWVELARVAAERLDDAALALFAARHALALDHDPELAGLTERIEPIAREQDAVLEAVRQAAASGSPERRDALRELATLLRSRPDRVEELIAVLRELVSLEPADRVWQRALERVLYREGKLVELESLLESSLGRSENVADHPRQRMLLSALRRKRGELHSALGVLTPLVDDSGAHLGAWSLALCLAARLGEERSRARALLRLAAPLSPSIRAVLTSVAAESLLDGGDLEDARVAADQAHHADPSRTRPVAVLAAVALQRRPDRSVADALERAMGVIVPRASLCEALANAHEILGEPQLALVWTQRWLSLRPGDPHAIRTLLGRVTETGDAIRLSDALSWLLSQPQSLADLVSPICAALLRLSELDPTRGAALARRALDVLGPKLDELRDTVTSIADSTNEHGLAIAVIERVLAIGIAKDNRLELLFELFERRKAAGDADGAARSLVRAIREGAAPERILSALSDTLPARSSDGELALLEARAEALARLSSMDAESAARAFRELGAALWDLAGDADGAVAAWERAALLDPVTGVARFARDFVAFGGHAEALRRLESFAERQPNPADASRLLAAGATVALAAGDKKVALRVASRALELDPSRADVLAIAERAAGAEDVEDLETIYQRLSDSALGAYGERAVHYRAARHFERGGDVHRALDHAVRAFEAVPAEGVSFVLMSRLAERANEAPKVVRALQRVADATRDASTRADWLRRASILGGTDEESIRLRVDVLLRALAVRPESSLVNSLGKAIADLSKISPEYSEIGTLRLTRALDALLPRAHGPEGARFCITAARVVFDVLEDSTLALRALERATFVDPDLEEFAELNPLAAALAREKKPANDLVAQVVTLAANPGSNAGRALLELAAMISRALADAKSTALLLVAAAERDPDDPDLARRAALAAQLAADASLLDRIAGAVPTAERIHGLVTMAESAERNGDFALAVDAYERVDSDRGAGEEDRRKARSRLRELYTQLGNHDHLELLLENEIEEGGLESDALARTTRDLSALYVARGKIDPAIELLERMLRTLPDHTGLLEDMAQLGAQAGDKKRRAGALSKLVDLMRGSDKIRVLRELAPLLEELGDTTGAAARWSELWSHDPNDVDALAALERDAENRGDFERAAALLARRAGTATRVEDVRRVRLKRAALLEERLGRADEARAELEALLAATGDHLAVLRVLADLHARLGAPLRAAPLWMRASAICTDRDEAADLAVRACEAYVAAGDIDAARRVLDGMVAWAQSERLLTLRVEIERKGDDARSLGGAIEELAGEVADDTTRHVGLLIDAARSYEAADALPDALAAAERAAEVDPSAPEPQILARWLEYRVRGPSTREHARLTVAALRGLDGQLTKEQAELRGFLVAEALDRAVGAGAGMRELSKLRSELGTMPLIALGIAERLSEGGEHATALGLFDVALSGDLRSVRPRGRVAIGAADSARQIGDFVRALGYCETAAAEPESKNAALQLQTQLRAEQLAMEMARERAARREASGVPRTQRSVSDLFSSPPAAAPVRPTTEPPPKTEVIPDVPGPRESEPRVPVAEPYPGPRESEPRIPVATTSAPPPRAPSAPPPRAETKYSAKPPPEELSPRAPSAAPAARVSDKPVATETPIPPIDMPAPSQRKVSGTFPAVSSMEAELLERLTQGSQEAGLELMHQLENRRSRSHDLVAVCRRLVALSPGNRDLLRRLHEAAVADKNHVYARSIEHVLGLFDPSMERPSPPPLGDQPEDPERVRAVLFRDLGGPAIEALGLVWDGASHVFRRDPATYGVTGMERIPLGSPTALGRTYTSAARVLGVTRTPLFQRKGFGQVALSVALLTPPAVIVTGEVARETPELAFHLGAMLLATLPELVLLFGSTEEQARTILKGLLLAFGPPEQHKASVASAANLAEVLWERVPSRSQRRLRELSHSPEGLDYDAANALARRAARRAGLFVSGDLALALRETAQAEQIPFSEVSTPGPLMALVAQNPVIADLVRLATSSEYAAARWQPARPGTRPGGAG